MKYFRKDFLKRAACMFFLISFVALAWGCGASESVENEGKQDQTPVSEEKDTPLSLGQTGKSESFEVSITKAEKATEWINEPKEGREYVVVSFLVSNISDEEQSIGADDFQFVGEDGYRESYAATTGVEADPKIFGAAELAPGETFRGSLAFAIPVTMSTVEMHFIESIGAEPLKFQFSK